MTCKQPECTNPIGKARGYCNAHLLRLYRGQDMSAPVRRPGLTDEERFWSKVDNKSSECWNWMGALTLGYGVFRIDGGNQPAHRVSYVWANGEIPEWAEVDHACFNKSCVNPSHLRLLSHSHNGQNRSGANRNSKSGVRGVYWVSARSLWLARAVINRVTYSVGAFTTLDEAEQAITEWRSVHMPHSIRDQQKVS